jgi:hypothetical protein
LCSNGKYCDGAEICDPAIGCKDGADPVCGDSVDCTLDACNEDTDSCDHTPDDSFCDDDDVCTEDSCEATGCVNDATAAEGDPCDADQNPCTGEFGIDSCVDGECVPGEFNFAECGICRTPGFWGQRGGTSFDRNGELAGFNYTQAVIDAAGGDCLYVCGQSICGTDSADYLGTFGSALEALCVISNDKIGLNQAYRQMVAANLNCVLSGGSDCEAMMNDILVGITWAQCDASCSSATPDKATLTKCSSQLDCWNNGYEVKPVGDGWGCFGECQGTSTECNTASPICPGACLPPPGNCHDRELCESANPEVIAELTIDNPFLSCAPDASESLGAAGGVEACKAAQGKTNTCSISNPTGCGTNLCDTCTPPSPGE